MRDSGQTTRRIKPLHVVRAVTCSLLWPLLSLPGAQAQEKPAGLNDSSQLETSRSQRNASVDCHVGTYRLTDGRDVDIAPDGENLEWRMKDGMTGELTRNPEGSWSSTLGMTGRPDGKRASFSDCAAERIRFDGVEGHRIAYDVFETTFQGAGVTLAGRLVMPKGKDRVPIVVLVHGSDRGSALEGGGAFALQRLFPSAGVGAFVYDKRGTGASGGKYTHDYLTLADDAIAAMREAKRLAGARAQRIGYLGTSEGGWVAPLAAKIEAVDFVLVAYGLAISPLDEDRSCLALDLTRRGYGADAVAKAMEIADATSIVLLSDFREGYDQVEAVRRKYEKEAWFPLLHGNVSFLILQRSPAELKELGPTLFPGLLLQYDPMPVLRNLRTPQLWVLGKDDIDAPSAETAARLKALAASGSPITTAVFPGAQHGMYEYEVASDGTRLSTRQPEGYFRMMVDFIRDGRLHGQYGADLYNRLILRRRERGKSIQD
jgi:dienelactone hydrolase